MTATLFAFNAAAADLGQEMNALGANKALMRKARAIDPQNRIRVVQHRDVDRHYRLEIGVTAALDEGGDPYVSTSSLGGHLDFHFTPRWSLGARFNNYSNSLTSEGKRVFDDAQARRDAGDVNYRIPDVDYAKNSYLAVVNWYPIYGKLNLFDVSIAQFDLYFLGGAGQIMLGSGSAPLYTAGGGVGIWLNQHMSTRLEARWQGYKDHVYDGSRNINQAVLSATLGFLL
jgi:outer membrane beta-barrel protein